MLLYVDVLFSLFFSGSTSKAFHNCASLVNVFTQFFRAKRMCRLTRQHQHSDWQWTPTKHWRDFLIWRDERGGGSEDKKILFLKFKFKKKCLLPSKKIFAFEMQEFRSALAFDLLLLCVNFDIISEKKKKANEQRDANLEAEREKCWYPVSMDTRKKSSELHALHRRRASWRCVSSAHISVNKFNIIKTLRYRNRCAAMSSDGAKDENWIRALLAALNAHAWETQNTTDTFFSRLLVCSAGVQKHIFAGRFPSINYSCSAAGGRGGRKIDILGLSALIKKSFLSSIPHRCCLAARVERCERRNIKSIRGAIVCDLASAKCVRRNFHLKTSWLNFK